MLSFIYKFSFAILAILLGSGTAFADIGSMASTLNSGMTNVVDLIGTIGYVAGMAFGVASVFKFKQHRDAPTQVPIGTPFAMLATAVALVYMPSLLSETGASVFSDTSARGTTGNYGTI